MKRNNLGKLLAVIAVVLVLCFCFTGCFGAPAATTTTAEDGTASSPTFFQRYGTIIIMVAIIVIFYFLFYRPESKKKKELAKQRDQITVGDEIVTIGGMTGTIVEDEGEYVVFETGDDRVRIKIARWGISTKATKGSGDNSKK